LGEEAREEGAEARQGDTEVRRRLRERCDIVRVRDGVVDLKLGLCVSERERVSHTQESSSAAVGRPSRRTLMPLSSQVFPEAAELPRLAASALRISRWSGSSRL